MCSTVTRSDIISKTKSKRVVILTTHSMEEADRLSDRIGMLMHVSACECMRARVCGVRANTYALLC